MSDNAETREQTALRMVQLADELDKLLTEATEGTHRGAAVATASVQQLIARRTIRLMLAAGQPVTFETVAAFMQTIPFRYAIAAEMIRAGLQEGLSDG